MKTNTLPEYQEELARFEGEGGHEMPEANPMGATKAGTVPKRRPHLNWKAMAAAGDHLPAATKKLG